MGVLTKIDGGVAGGVRRMAAKVAAFGMVVTSVTAGVVLVSPTLAGADSPNPTSGTGTAEIVDHPSPNIGNVIKVTLTGTWDWERGNWCFNDRYAAGWEIDWNDPNQPGHFVDTLNGVSYEVGVAAGGMNLNAFDNTVDFYNDANRCGTRPAGSDRDIGNWGPITHYYALGTNVITPCAVTYDIHKDGNTFKQDDLVAGGAGHNNDNSIEKNSADQNICFPITVLFQPTLTLQKEVDNAKGGSATTADFTLTATGPSSITGKHGEAAVTNKTVTAGTYTLSESFTVTNYTPDANWVCTGGGTFVAPNKITVANANPAQNVTCKIINRNNGSTDLKLTKSDGGALVTAGQANSFNYTITVDNIGTTDAANPATISDQMPAWFDVQSVTAPAGTTCNTTGDATNGGRETVTCTVPAADLQVADPAVTITVAIKVLAGAPSGKYENKATVDTPDDPLCPAGGPLPCPPPCPPGGGNPPGNNNVACDETDIDRAAQLAVDKVDDVNGTIKPGDTYSYDLKVTNNGPSTVTNISLTDDFPSALTVQSVVAGAGWTGCAVGDPLANCIYAGPLAVNATTTTVKVTVKLASNYQQSTISNTAFAVGVADDKGTPGNTADDVPTNTAQDTEITNVLTNVDLVLTKNDGGAVVVAGHSNSFNYTITVDNAGTRDVTAAATVNDTFPAWFEVQTGTFNPPAGVNCNVNGSAANGGQMTVVCTVPANMLEANDPAVQIIVPVKVLAGAPSGTYTNRGYVDVIDDPVCPAGGPLPCPPPCPPGGGNPANNNVGCDDTPVSRSATLTVSKDDNVSGGTSIKPGESFTYTLKVRNNGPSTVTNVVLTDDFPAGLTVTGVVAGAGWNGCAATDPLGTCTFAGPLAVNAETTTVVVTVKLSNTYAQTTVVNVAKAIALVDDNNTPGNPADDKFTPEAQDDETTPVNTTVDLVLTKTDGGISAVAGGAGFNYTVTVDNAGTRDVVNNATVVDTLPAWFEFQTASFVAPAGVTCNVAGSAANGGQQTVTCTVSSTLLDVSDPAVSIVLPVKVLAGAPSGTHTNRATVDVVEDPLCPAGGPLPCPPPCPIGGGNPVGNNNVGCDDTPVSRNAVLVVDKADDVANGVSIKPGDTYNYKIKVTNNGPSTVTLVKLTDVLPAGLTLVAANTSGTNWTCNNQQSLSCTYSLGLAPTESTSVLNVQVTLSAQYTQNNVNNVAVGTATVEPGKDVTAQDDENTPVLTPVDLTLDKSDGGALAVAGSPNVFDYTITVKNIGLKNLANVAVVTDILPAGFVFQSAVGATCNVAAAVAPNGETVTCQVPAASLPAGGAGVVITIKVLVSQTAPAGVYTNKAFVDTQEDPVCTVLPCNPPCPPNNPNNNVDCEPTDLVRQAELQVSKVDNVATNVTPGGQFQYSITVKNNGPSSVTNVRLSDDLPNVLTIKGASGAGWNCTVADPLNCTYASGLLKGETTNILTVTVELAASFSGTSVVNTAVGTATVEPGKDVQASDDETTPVGPGFSPISGISIIKRVNGFDANAAPGLIVNAGATLVFTYEVSNTGNVALTNVTVKDDKVATVTCPSTTLAPNASMVCTAVGAGPASGQYTNVGTATGTPPSGPNVTATDSANVFVAVPAIEVTKLVNGADANSAPGLNIPVGSQVSWTFRVENTGNVDLKDIKVTDDKVTSVDCGGGSNTIAALRIGEQKTCQATGVAQVGLFTNVATVTGTPNPPLLPGQPPAATTPVTDADSANYTGTETVPPSVLPPTLPPDDTLPETGGSPAGTIGLAAGLLLLGGLLLSITWIRRRKPLA